MHVGSLNTRTLSMRVVVEREINNLLTIWRTKPFLWTQVSWFPSANLGPAIDCYVMVYSAIVP